MRYYVEREEPSDEEAGDNTSVCSCMETKTHNSSLLLYHIAVRTGQFVLWTISSMLYLVCFGLHQCTPEQTSRVPYTRYRQLGLYVVLTSTHSFPAVESAERSKYTRSYGALVYTAFTSTMAAVVLPIMLALTVGRTMLVVDAVFSRGQYGIVARASHSIHHIIEAVSPRSSETSPATSARRQRAKGPSAGNPRCANVR